MNVEKLEKIILRYVEILNIEKTDFFNGVRIDIVPPNVANSTYLIFVNFIYDRPWNDEIKNSSLYAREIINFIEKTIANTSLENNHQIYVSRRTLKNYLEDAKPTYDKQKKYSIKKNI